MQVNWEKNGKYVKLGKNIQQEILLDVAHDRN